MSTFTGILNISSNGTSSLNTSNLLMAGIADAATAIAAATQFLVAGRHLSSGQMILVDGFAGILGTVHIIRMTDAHAVKPEALKAIPLGARANAKAIIKQRSTKPSGKKPSKKRTSRKPGKSPE